MRLRPLSILVLFLGTTLAGCIAGDEPDAQIGTDDVDLDQTPYLDYVPVDPDAALQLVQESHLIDASEGIQIHGRVVRPAGDGPFPVIIEYTPYTAPGENVVANNGIEPAVPISDTLGGSFVGEFVRRGYAFVFADVRGTGDSTGCLDLRGPKDIEDQYHLIEHYGTIGWSNGKVGFIGASYPGSTSHMAALAGNPHLGAVVPVVASTSFYHYHHNDGVPYNGNHAVVGTNSLYSAFALAPTVNPQESNYASKYAEEAQCSYNENWIDHGFMDQSGDYYEWWQDRNLRTQSGKVDVPVLMGQGLADWNVKPDHIATWYNDIASNKTLIAGQWGHQYPENAEDAYGDWGHYVTAFFDTHLKGIDTGMFGTDVAWVQDSDGDWHRSSNWPLLATERDEVVYHFQADGELTDVSATDGAELAWAACPRDTQSKGIMSNAADRLPADHCDPGAATEQVFETQPFAEDTLLSGVPLVNLTLRSTSDFTHLVVVMQRLDENGTLLSSRENYGYLNPTYRHGIDDPQPVPTDETYEVTIDLYPQEDLVKKGDSLRFIVRSHDDARTIEAYEPGTNTLVFGSDAVNKVTLPIRPAPLQGVRLGHDDSQV